jgi:MOSC domain-containing protein YiiM
MASVLSINVGGVRPVEWGATPAGSAIDKRPVRGPVTVGRLGLAGDEQADRKHHGGVDQAVYAYAREDLDFWAGEAGRDLRAGQFGENLTTAGVEVTGAVIGERWRVGTAVLEVSAPRIPCRVFASWMEESHWVKRFTAAGRPGAYLRVVVTGELAAGDPVVVEHRPTHGVTVGETFRALSGEHALAGRLLLAAELPAKVRDKVRGWADAPAG